MTTIDTNTQQDYISIQRKMLEVLVHTSGQELENDSLTFADILSNIEDGLREIRILGTESVSDVSLQELIQDYWEHIKQRKASAPTGLERLNDALNGGLEAKRLMVLLGPPGIGKTALAHQMVDHAANSGRPVLYATSEDIPFTLFCKGLANTGLVPYSVALKGSDREKINAAIAMQMDRTASQTLHYVDATQRVELERIGELAQAHFERYASNGQGILVIDYLQRFARAQRSSQAYSLEIRELVTQLTERLRAMACELDCTVIALGSQKRMNGQTETLFSGKESGDIEYTADILATLVEDKDSKPSTYLKHRLLKLDKNRQGDTTSIKLKFEGEKQRFTEVGND